MSYLVISTYQIFLLFFEESEATMDEHEFKFKYMHSQDTRSSEEILLSNLLIRKISENNLERIRSKRPQQVKETLDPPKKVLKKQDFLYVCFHGTPPYQDEFSLFNLPGQMLVIQPETYQFGLVEEERKERVKYSTMEVQSKKVHDLINSRSLTKRLVLVFHSFGTYLVSSYLHLYGSVRVIGMVDIGGAPVTMYPIIKNYLMIGNSMDFETIEENIQFMYSQNKQEAVKNKTKPLDSKYMILSFFVSLLKGIAFEKMFDFNRKWPNVLKCIIYGKKDHIFPEDLMNEKAIYYCYKMPFQKQYQQRLIKKYGQKYNKSISNAQQKFIFNFEDGFHSLHMQKKLKEKLKNIVNQYLEFIEEEAVSSKL